MGARPPGYRDAMKPKTDFDRFKEATARILTVSKEELERREAEWRKEREKQQKGKKA